jgi:Domain of Unknown Function (DUF326)
MSSAAMLDTHPSGVSPNREAIARAIDATLTCSQTCTACADACLAEPDVAEMAHCIRDDLDCADVCQATSRVLTRQTAHDAALKRAVLEACIQVCRACAVTCGEHRDHHKHCRICADTCDDCAQACQALLDAL